MRVYDCNTRHAVLVPVHFHVYDMHVLVCKVNNKKHTVTREVRKQLHNSDTCIVIELELKCSH